VATLYISEYHAIANLGTLSGGGTIHPQAPQEPADAEQFVTISGSSTQSAAFSSTTTFIRVNCDAICSILFGQNPVALTTIKRLAANQTEFFGILAGQKLAVIANV
jgi:hypothetical protein